MKRPMKIKRVVAVCFILLFVVSVLAVPFSYGAKGATIAKTISGASPPPSIISQSFSIGGGQYSSNVNYFINDGGTLLPSASTTVTLTGPLSGSSSAGGGNWSLQMNAYAPDKCGQSSCQAAYLQFVVSYSSSTVEFSEEYWSVSSSDLFGAASQTNYPVPSNDFANGMTIQVSVLENSTDNVIGSSLQINGTKGNILVSSVVMNSAGAVINGHSGVWEEYASPIVGWEVQLVGFGGASTATFTHASGEFSYGSSAPLAYGNSASDVNYAEYNQSVAGTAEKSNIAYGTPSQEGTTTSTSQTSTSVSTLCENCLSTTTTQVVPYSVKQGQFAEDLGKISYSTSLQGFTWNVTDSQSLTLGLPAGVSIPSIDYNTSLTFLSSASFSMYFKPQGYQTLITITGISTGLQTCIPLNAAGGQITYNQTANPAEASLSSDILSWGDIPLSYTPSYSSGQGLCYAAPLGPYTIDPIALDGGVQNGCAAATCGVTFSSTSSPDVIIIFTVVGQNHNPTAPTVPGGCTGLTNRESYSPSG